MCRYVIIGNCFSLHSSRKSAFVLIHRTANWAILFERKGHNGKLGKKYIRPLFLVAFVYGVRGFDDYFFFILLVLYFHLIAAWYLIDMSNTSLKENLIKIINSKIARKRNDKNGCLTTNAYFIFENNVKLQKKRYPFMKKKIYMQNCNWANFRFHILYQTTIHADFCRICACCYSVSAILFQRNDMR